ncbi:MAG: ABC transporter permease [Vicinamibacterales bacterium]
MRTRPTRAASAYRLLLRCYPASFRARFERDLLELFEDLHSAAAPPRIAFWVHVLIGTLRHGLAERIAMRSQPRPFPPRPGDSTMTTLANDLRLAFRSFRSQPAFTVTVIATMALGIGVTSAIFTVVNAVLLRPLPYDRPEQVVMLFERDPRGATAQVSLQTFEDWRARLTTFTHLATFGSQTANLTGVGEPDRLRAAFVSADFFAVLGVSPLLGRGFTEADDQPGAGGVAVLPHGVWTQRFGADPDILGRTITLNNLPFEVIGVLPRSFEFPFDDIEAYLPAAASPEYATLTGRATRPGLPASTRERRALFVFGRVADGVSLDAASAEMRQVSEQLAAAFPDTNAGWSAEITPFHAVAVRLVRTPLYVLMGAVLLVLLIACFNVANLTLARGTTRAREMAVRAALGAGRRRLAAQLLTESLVLAVAGGTLGLLLGAALTEGLLALAPPLPRSSTIGPDPAVLAFTAVISIVTGLLFGVVPALRGSRVPVRESLQEGSRATDARRGRLRQALVVAELALSLVLLVAAGLLARSLAQMARTDLGFTADGLLTLEYRLPRNKYAEAPQQWDVHRRILESVANLPGIERVALASALPFSGNGNRVAVWRAEDPEPEKGTATVVMAVSITDGYFAAMEIPVIGGRTCSRGDTPGAALAVMVNRHLAERMWPGQSPVGRRVRATGVAGEGVVVGVVGDTIHAGYRAGVGPQLYACFAQSPQIFATMIARTTGDPMASARAVQQAVWAVDPDQPMWKIRSMTSMVASGTGRERLLATLMAAAAVLALGLAAVGVYGVVSYSVTRRAREISVRMALGASRGSILGMVLRETAGVVALGLSLGFLGSLASSRLIANQLHEVAPGDAGTLILTGLVLAFTALMAAALPAARAASADPVTSLRLE